MVKKRSLKYFNERIEQYCQDNNIDMTRFIENRAKNQAEKKAREQKGKEKKKTKTEDG